MFVIAVGATYLTKLVKKTSIQNVPKRYFCLILDPSVLEFERF